MTRLYGFNKIGRISNLPEQRRGGNSTGCYLHDFQIQDLKINSWAYRMGLPFMVTGMKAWFENLHRFIVDNKEMLERHVAEKSNVRVQ